MLSRHGCGEVESDILHQDLCDADKKRIFLSCWISPNS